MQFSGKLISNINVYIILNVFKRLLRLLIIYEERVELYIVFCHNESKLVLLKIKAIMRNHICTAKPGLSLCKHFVLLWRHTVASAH